MRKKLKLAFILNDSARRISYKKRKKGLIKKLQELTTLCGIEACAIIYSEFDPQPDIWPSPWEVLSVVTKFKNVPKMDQSRKMLNQESFLKQRILKVKEQLAKVKKDNREKEMSSLMFRYLVEGKVLDNLSIVDLNDLAWLISQKQEEINSRMSALDKKALTTQSQAQVVAPIVIDGATRQGEEAQVDPGQGFEMNMNATQNEPWILDLINGGGEPHVYHDQGFQMNMNAIQNVPWFLDLINGGEDEMLPFGDINYPKK